MNKRGFTLIELLVTVAIIAVLSAVGLSNFTSAQRRARDARRQADLRTIQGAAELYYNECGRYPDDSTEFKNTTTGCTNSGIVQYLQSGGSTAAFLNDPRGGSADTYEVIAAETNNNGYQACADLEIDPGGAVDTDWAAATDEDNFCVSERQ